MSKKLLLGAIASIIAINSVFADTTSTVTSRQYVDNALETKQDKITTGYVETSYDSLPALVSYYDGELTGNKIGILDSYTVEEFNESKLRFLDKETEGRDYDTVVPTVTLVADAIEDLWRNKQDSLRKNNETAYPNGSLVTYGIGVGEPGVKKIVTTVANGGTDIPTDGAVYTAISSKQNKMTCAQWVDGADHTDVNCLLWNVAN